MHKAQGVTINGKRMRLGVLTCLVSVLFAARISASDEVEPNGLVFIPGGVFKMGGDAGLMSGGSQSHGTSYPVHEVYVDGFWMDETEVTNQQFADFVQDTGYVTIAERQLSEDCIREMSQLANARIRELEAMQKRAISEEKAAIASAIERIKEASSFGETAGSIVFKEPVGTLHSKYDYTQWWRLVPDANWRSPEGGDSTWRGREDHPVVNLVMRMLRRMPSGRVKDCPQRQSGNALQEEAWSVSDMRGITGFSRRERAFGWQTFGRVSGHLRIHAKTDILAPRRLEAFHRIATGFMTWPEMFGSLYPISTTPTHTARAYRARYRIQRG